MPRINSYDPNYNSRLLFAEETEKVEQKQLYNLIELVLPEPEPSFKIVDANHDVVLGWGGNPVNKGEYTYTKFPVKFNPAEINTDGSLSKASIVIANVSREIMYYVERYNGLMGLRVHIKKAYANVLYYTYSFDTDGSVIEIINPDHNPDAILWDEYVIDSYSANETTVSFSLDPVINLEIRLPRRRYLIDSCAWRFADPETCGYVGEDTFCNKTLAACKEKNNQRYFGGMPGISGSRKIFL